jgi:hypothetical protein
MKYLALCLTAVTLIMAGAATAQAASSDQADGARPKKEKRVCRERQRSGSHLSNVVCKTPEQWARLQAEFDDQDQYGIPGNRGKTARDMNVSPQNRVPF